MHSIVTATMKAMQNCLWSISVSWNLTQNQEKLCSGNDRTVVSPSFSDLIEEFCNMGVKTVRITTLKKRQETRQRH